MSAFESLGLMPELIHAAETMQWYIPRDVQDEAIPLILGGGDVMVAAETGSGKTGAFALPVIQLVHESINGIAHVERLIEEPSPSSSSSSSFSSDTPRFSNSDRDPQFNISSCGYDASSSSAADWFGGRCTHAATSGRVYFECTPLDQGLCRVGWSTPRGRRNLGTDAFSWGFGGTGKKSTNRRFEDYGVPYSSGDVVGCALDLSSGCMAFSINGKSYGDAFVIPPSQLQPGVLPSVVLKTASLRLNLGQAPLQHLPSGYTSFLDSPTLKSSVELSKSTSSSTSSASSSTSTSPASTKKSGKRTPIALVIEPSRELALQTKEQFDQLVKFVTQPKLHVGLLLGGAALKDQLKMLQSDLDVLIATPGRLVDLIDKGSVDLSALEFFVIDEADALVDAGNIGLLLKIYEQRTASSHLQVLLFSATLRSPEISRLADKITCFPSWVDLKGANYVPDTVDHAFVSADPSLLEDLWRELEGYRTDGVHQELPHADHAAGLSERIKRLKPLLLRRVIDAHEMEQALIFVRTRLDAEHLADYLNGLRDAKQQQQQQQQQGALAARYSAAVLHGGRGDDRQVNLDLFKSGDVRFLVCTDLAARGIDITGLPFVINMTLPDSPAEYIHRVGRVGRADAMGLAISIVGSAPEKVWYHTCRNKGKGCANRRLKSEGGCCIWYDEPDLLRQIEERLQQTVLPIGADFRFPGFQPGATYGRKRNEMKLNVLDGHAEFLSRALADVSHLEELVQRSYWNRALIK